MQSSWLTIWNRRIRESGIRLQEPDCACVHACVLACVRVSQCVSQCVSKRERARKRDFDCEVWTCVSRLASVAPDRHTQAQRHTYRFVTHPWGRSVQCACSPVSHSFTYIKMSLRYGALPEDLLLSVTACVDLHTSSAAKSWILRVKTKMWRSQQTMTPVSLLFQLKGKLFLLSWKPTLKTGIWTSVPPHSECLRAKCWILPSSDLQLSMSCSFFWSQVVTTIRAFSVL